MLVAVVVALPALLGVLVPAPAAEALFEAGRLPEGVGEGFPADGAGPPGAGAATPGDLPALAAVARANEELARAQLGLAEAEQALVRARAGLAASLQRLAELHQVRGQLEARVTAAEANEGDAARRLAEGRDRLKRMAVAGYVSGGPGRGLATMLQAGDVTAASRGVAQASLLATVGAHAVAAREEAHRAAWADVAAAVAAVADVDRQRAAAEELVRAAEAEERARAGAVPPARARVEAAAATVARAELEARGDVATNPSANPPINPAANAAPNPVVMMPVAVGGIPAVSLDAYRRAAATLAAEAPACGMTWSVLAGVARVESNHGRYRGAVPGPDGSVRPAIIGIPLDGTNRTRVVRDTDRGRLDGDDEFDRAVGPLQFIPSTWKARGRDGNGDGIADPHNLYDASLSAAAYLCRAAGAEGLGPEAGMRRALLAYNRSVDYGTAVIAWQRTYAALLSPGG